MTADLSELNFELDDTTKAITEAVRDRCAAFDESYWEQCDAKSRFPEEFVASMAEGGFLGFTVPEEYGGGGQGHVAAAAMLREISASGACLNGCVPVHMTMFAVEPIVRFGSDEMKQRFLPQICEGKLQLCFAVTEPDTGSDTSRIKTAAKATPDGWSVSGQKVWITLAHIADAAILLARTGPAPESDRFGGLSLFLADLDGEHTTAKPTPKLPHNAAVSCELFLDDLPVDRDRLIGEEGRGFRHILPGLNSERVLMAAEMVGIGQAALRRGSDYARERVVFGRAVGANQAISHPLARASAMVSSAWLATLEAAWRLDRGLPCGAQANSAKFLAAEAAYAAADAALQAHGGMGFGREYHVERYFREARLCRVAPISQEMTLNFLAQQVLELPRSY
ncbi:MAG TPA: acyl-CoA dehydrogenase family protein [Baekduia sp.]|nr:acyl-CoA dehydrogenase family protein [Baekduia sp.]